MIDELDVFGFMGGYADERVTRVARHAPLALPGDTESSPRAREKIPGRSASTSRASRYSSRPTQAGTVLKVCEKKIFLLVRPLYQARVTPAARSHTHVPGVRDSPSGGSRGPFWPHRCRSLFVASAA